MFATAPSLPFGRKLQTVPPRQRLNMVWWVLIPSMHASLPHGACAAESPQTGRLVLGCPLFIELLMTSWTIMATATWAGHIATSLPLLPGISWTEPGRIDSDT